MGIARINSAKLTSENYSINRGTSCPICGYTHRDPDGSPRWYVGPREQKFMGLAEPPWKGGNIDTIGAVFECITCFGLYWFHVDPQWYNDDEEEEEEKT